MTDKTSILSLSSRRDLQWGDKLSFDYLGDQDAYVYGVISPSQYKVVIVPRPKRKSFWDFFNFKRKPNAE